MYCHCPSAPAVPLECEVAVVVSERPEFREERSGEKNSHGVVVFPVSGECAFSDGDAGAGFGVVGDIGASFTNVLPACVPDRSSRRNCCSARGQCGRSEDCQSFIGVFHSCAVLSRCPNRNRRSLRRSAPTPPPGKELANPSGCTICSSR